MCEAASLRLSENVGLSSAVGSVSHCKKRAPVGADIKMKIWRKELESANDIHTVLTLSLTLSYSRSLKSFLTGCIYHKSGNSISFRKTQLKFPDVKIYEWAEKQFAN